MKRIVQSNNPEHKLKTPRQEPRKDDAKKSSVLVPLMFSLFLVVSFFFGLAAFVPAGLAGSDVVGRIQLTKEAVIDGLAGGFAGESDYTRHDMSALLAHLRVVPLERVLRGELREEASAPVSQISRENERQGMADALERKDTERATLYARVLSADDQPSWVRAEALQVLALIHAAQNLHKEAHALIAQAVAVGARDAVTLIDAGDLSHRAGYHSQAINYYVMATRVLAPHRGENSSLYDYALDRLSVIYDELGAATG